MTENVFYQAPSVTRTARERLNGHRAIVIWFTGLSGAGKTTLANALEAELHRQGRRTLVLDGDNVRQGLCSDLGFSAKDRHENLRRVGEMARMTMEAGVITLAAFISPFEEDRARVRDIVGPENLFEIYVRCPLAVCETRDVKGLYRKARQGEISHFTGVSAPYEEPTSAHLVLDTSVLSASECVGRMLESLQSRLALPGG
ncbi:adenylyl-sulfate kinase [Noviherbaspirillum sp. 1P10PC]|uniref:adenylyl-sulfate kinase n=1 Tax=Noviherbaspirillum sp. 1P10PC TaxID=3132292 RepID=UPI0039A36D9F